MKMVSTFGDNSPRKGVIIAGGECPQCGGPICQKAVGKTFSGDVGGNIVCRDPNCDWEQDDR